LYGSKASAVIKSFEGKFEIRVPCCTHPTSYPSCNNQETDPDQGANNSTKSSSFAPVSHLHIAGDSLRNRNENKTTSFTAELIRQKEEAVAATN
jgi:hypothetical protein